MNMKKRHRFLVRLDDDRYQYLKELGEKAGSMSQAFRRVLDSYRSREYIKLPRKDWDFLDVYREALGAENHSQAISLMIHTIRILERLGLWKVLKSLDKLEEIALEEITCEEEEEK